MKWNGKVILCMLMVFFILSSCMKEEPSSVYEIGTNPFLFHGKELSFGIKKYTQEGFSKKYGEPSDKELVPGGLHLLYEDEGIDVFFNEESELEGLMFDMSFFGKVTLYGLTINKDDTYKSLRKKLEDEKLYFSVTEYPQVSLDFSVTLFEAGPIYSVKISCSPNGNHNVERVYLCNEY